MTVPPVPGVSSLLWLREDAVGTYEAGTDDATGARVGVRRLHARLAHDEAARLLFAEETRRIATLDAPFLLRVLRSDPRALHPWIVTEAIDGPTLEADVARAPWTEEAARPFVVGLARALRALETRRQFHAALLPSRFVRVGEGWRLTTFRDVRAEDEALRLKGRPGADPRFAPPEVVGASNAPTKARTLGAWALGALWTWLCSGHPPGESAWRPTPVRDRDAHALLLAHDPALRPQDAAAVLALLGEGDATAPTPPGRSWRDRRR